MSATNHPERTAVQNSIVLTIECPNRVGIVAAVASFLAERGLDIADSQQYDDRDADRFFMRVVATAPEGVGAAALREEFAPIARDLRMTWHLGDAAERMRTLVMVSRDDHCLTELIDVWRSGWSNLEIVAVVGNHEDLRPLVEREGLRFIHVPVTRETKPEAEEELLRIVAETGAELVVLARYMQILSDGLCDRLAGRVINIHHSFLPGFKGARPYRQAWERGVKIVGATSHYVTGDLDEGPIIAQSVFPVDHRAAPRDLAIAGRRAERAALSQAVAWHTERRIFVNGARTVIFD